MNNNTMTNFFQSHFERIILEFGRDIDYLIKMIQRNMVTASQVRRLEDRVAVLEKHCDIKEIQTIIDKKVLENEDLKEGELSIRIDENTRRVLLKSPENINDDTWVHVSNVINEV